ncbi:MAG: hypothetical protein RMY64_26105 [Nostoc sp. DedQUE08]|nr:hypothetical protein [Nostoc sp. DedQUE08]
MTYSQRRPIFGTLPRTGRRGAAGGNSSKFWHCDRGDSIDLNPMRQEGNAHLMNFCLNVKLTQC